MKTLIEKLNLLMFLEKIVLQNKIEKRTFEKSNYDGFEMGYENQQAEV